MIQRPKTYLAKPSEMNPRWHVIDASGQRLGRLASQIAQLLQGKHKPIYTPHTLTGDFVVVINARKLEISGRKAVQKIYYRHSQYPGGLRAVPLEKMMQRFPERVVERAIKQMLPGTTLGRAMFRRLKVYADDTHPHEAQVNAGTGKKKAEHEKTDSKTSKPNTQGKIVRASSTPANVAKRNLPSPRPIIRKTKVAKATSKKAPRKKIPARGASNVSPGDEIVAKQKNQE
jgi:large subunit ribosomal protein L13